MKKKRTWLILILATVLLFPVRCSYKDGGTVVYRAILYEVADRHTINSETTRGEIVNAAGVQVRILGLPIYDGSHLAKWSHGRLEPLPSLPRGKQGVLWVMDDGGTVRTFTYSAQGAEITDTVHAHWEINGCELTCKTGDYPVFFIVSVGEDVTLWLGDTDAARTYRFYFAAEDAPLPDMWRNVEATKAKTAQAQAAYGTFDAFAASRDQSTELKMICALLPERTKDHAEDWYDMLLRGLWLNGDTAVTFAEVARDEDDSNWVELVLAGSDGQEYRLQGDSFWLLPRAVFCNGKLYYGPFR